MGRWSRPLAREFLGWLEPEPGGHWLDVGTGTGALATAIVQLTRPASVVGCDPSEAFIKVARSRLDDPRATFRIAGADNLPQHEGRYDAVVSGLALNFFPDPAGAVANQLDAVHDGGLVAAFVWDYAEGMEFLRHFWDVAVQVEPSAATMDEGRRFPICRPEELSRLFEEAGGDRVRVASISVPTVFVDFDDYWRPFLGGTGPAPSLVSTLSDQQRHDLKVALRAQLGAKDGMSIELEARAWAVACRRRGERS